MSAKRKHPINSGSVLPKLIRLFRHEADGSLSCFSIQAKRPTNRQAFLNGLKAMFSYLPTDRISQHVSLPEHRSIVGPRLTVETPFSSTATEIAHAIGLAEVERIEQFRVLPLQVGQDPYAVKFDRVREQVFDQLPTKLQTSFEVEQVIVIPLLTEGRSALERFVADHSLGFRPFQIELIERIFRSLNQNPTDTALYYLAQQWSDHCWHFLFMLADIIIDGKPLNKKLFEMLIEPLKELEKRGNHNISVAMHDDASATIGLKVPVPVPEHPGRWSRMILVEAELHITVQAETHNYPSQEEAEEGTATELGGGIRDSLAPGQGGDIICAWAMRVVGSISFPSGYRIPGEFAHRRPFALPTNKETPWDIATKGSIGWRKYANCFGKPCAGFEFYSGAVVRPRLVNGKIVREWLESLKPVCFSFGVGVIRKEHLVKGLPEKGMLIVQIGGPAYRVGKCGGSGSSSPTGTNSAEFDENAVQRGLALMEMHLRRVIVACLALGKECPIVANHDQGAGGISTCLTELMGKLGGKLYIGAVTVGDPSMSKTEIFICEYQERQGFLVWPDKLEILEQICLREGRALEVLGQVTGDGMIRVYGESSEEEAIREAAAPLVELPAEQVLGKYGSYTIEDQTIETARLPLRIPNLTFTQLFHRLLRRSEVASTRWFLRGVDQTVTGRTVVSPSCGPHYQPVNHYSLLSLTASSREGEASAIGTAPYLTALDSEAGVRLSLARTITSLMGVCLNFKEIQLLCNWMWPANINPPDGEVAALVQAVKAVNRALIALYKAIIGGKDSSSLATKVRRLKRKLGELDMLVKSIPTVVFSTAVRVPDITKHLTADIKHPGTSQLVLVDIARGKRRLGGSSFGQSIGQLGDYGPDMDNPQELVRCFNAVQDLIVEGLVSAGLDNRNGGLATTVFKMCVAGDCGSFMNTSSSHNAEEELLAEELGYVMEVPDNNFDKVVRLLKQARVKYVHLGRSLQNRRLTIIHNNETVLNKSINSLRRIWERTSHEFELGLINPDAARREWRNTRRITRPRYKLTFNPDAWLLPGTLIDIWENEEPVNAAVIRDVGTNGDDEFHDVLRRAGFTPYDVCMNDLLHRELTSLKMFQFVVFPGGFSEGDVLGAAVGWALKIEHNPWVKVVFDEFFAREDTMSLGICNGAQLGLRCGWAPLPDLPKAKRPLLTLGPLGSFNHGIVSARIEESPAIMLQGMAGSILPTPVAHGEGYFNCDHAPEVFGRILDESLVAFSYVDPYGRRTNALPHCPSGCFVAGVCDPTGRHLYTMLHGFERYNQIEKMVHVPSEWQGLTTSPWLPPLIETNKWCREHR